MEIAQSHLKKHNYFNESQFEHYLKILDAEAQENQISLGATFQLVALGAFYRGSHKVMLAKDKERANRPGYSPGSNFLASANTRIEVRSEFHHVFQGLKHDKYFLDMMEKHFDLKDSVVHHLITAISAGLDKAIKGTLRLKQVTHYSHYFHHFKTVIDHELTKQHVNSNLHARDMKNFNH